MKKLLSGNFLALFFITALLAAGCKKDQPQAIDPADVGTTAVITNVTPTTATVSGIILASDPITANGICWSSTKQEPTLEDSKVAGDSLTLRFSGKLTGLTPSTLYYARAYATNRAGTSYGGVIQFTTSSATFSTTVTVSTLAGSPSGAIGYANGTGDAVLFNGPQTLSYNPVTGLINVGDVYNNTVRTLSTSGTAATLTDTARGYVDGNLVAARFYGIKGTAIDGAGNVYVADAVNNVIRKITAGGVVSTYAGSLNGEAGFADATKPTDARFRNPQCVAVDAGGNVYVADLGNKRIRKISSVGAVSTLAGDGTDDFFDSTDGSLASFKLGDPVAMAIDPVGNIYIADQNNKAIRKIESTSGAVTTVAGGTDYPDQIGIPTGIAVDAQSNVYISDQRGRILKLTIQRVLYTLAGKTDIKSLVNGAGADARFNSPQGLTLDPSGNLYVADFGNNVVRKLTIVTTP